MCHAVPGKWCVFGCMLSAGGSFQWLRNQLGAEEMAVAQRKKIDPYELLVERARQAHERGATELHIVGGLHHKLPFDYYVDVVRWMHESVSTRTALWAGWATLATPVVAAAFDAPGTRTLRTLVPRRTLVAHVLLLLTAAQLPWAALFARGSGAVAAIDAALVAVAVEASAIAASRRPRHVLLLAVAATLIRGSSAAR